LLQREAKRLTHLEIRFNALTGMIQNPITNRPLTGLTKHNDRVTSKEKNTLLIAVL
jgi:hypothetical protein